TFNLKDSSSSVEYYDPADMDTEVRILKSDLLALQVIRQLNLDKQPEFGGSKSPSSSLPLTTDAMQPDSARTSAVLASLKGNLQVALVPNTRIIEIRYRSQDTNRVHHAGVGLALQAVSGSPDKSGDLSGKTGQVSEGTRNSWH